MSECVWGKKGQRALSTLPCTVFEQVTEMELIQDTCVQDSGQSQKMTEKPSGIEFISINFICIEVRHLNQSFSP